jgi:hypothetical protein
MNRRRIRRSASPKYKRAPEAPRPGDAEYFLTLPRSPFAFTPAGHKREDIQLPKRNFEHSGQRGALHAIFGPSGVGKSTYGTARAVAYITGNSDISLGEKVIRHPGDKLPYKAAIFDAEDTEDLIRARLYAIADQFKLDPRVILDNLALATTEKDDKAMVLAVKEDGKVVATPQARGLEYFIRRQGIGLLVIGPLAELQSGLNENDTSDMKELVSILRGIAQRTGCEIDIIAHAPKSMSFAHGDLAALRGSGFTGGALRSGATIMRLKWIEAKALRVSRKTLQLTTAKVSTGPEPERPSWFAIKLCPFGEGQSVGLIEAVKTRVDGAGAAAAVTPTDQCLRALVVAMETMCPAGAVEYELAMGQAVKAVMESCGRKKRQARVRIEETLPTKKNARMGDSSEERTFLLDEVLYTIQRKEGGKGRGNSGSVLIRKVRPSSTTSNDPPRDEAQPDEARLDEAQHDGAQLDEAQPDGAQLDDADHDDADHDDAEHDETHLEKELLDAYRLKLGMV